MLPLETLIEGILFIHPEGMTEADLASATGASGYEVAGALLVLKEKLADRGIQLVQAGEKNALRARSEATELFALRAEERLHADLGQGALEVLAIVLYHAPVSQTRIDYLRGVRSHGIAKNLLLRGLIEKKQHEDKVVYVPTVDLCSHLGVREPSELPEYQSILERSTKIASQS